MLAAPSGRYANGYCCIEDFEDSEEYVRTKIKQLKSLVDDALGSNDPDYWDR